MMTQNTSQLALTATLALAALLGVSSLSASSQGTVRAELQPFLKESCLPCHGPGTTSRLDFTKLGESLSDPATFRQWVRVFDRVHDGSMPPASSPRPQKARRDKALSTLQKALHTASVAQQRKNGRVLARRLTRLEYGYTLQDLLKIEENVSKTLPEEVDSGGFDTVGATQRISPLHLRSYLEAADLALDAAIHQEKRPQTRQVSVDYLNSAYVNRWYDLPLNQGGGVTEKLEDAVAVFADIDYIFRTDACGLSIGTPGQYRITLEAYPYQAKTPTTLKLLVVGTARGGSQLLGAYDLLPGQTRQVTVTTTLHPGDYLYPSLADPDRLNGGVYAAGGAKNYKGKGIAIKSLKVEGPLIESWPPASTRQLLPETPTKPTIAQLTETVGRIAPLAFRRPVAPSELNSFVALAKPALAQGRPPTEALRLPLRSMLSAPQLLFFAGKPGKLDDYALASRLSYFLWKSLPDATLLQLAKEGKLSQLAVLHQQVERMIRDPKFARFQKDFLGQWLRLYDINATKPDERLYPEYDDVLSAAIPRETELFFNELVAQNLSVRNLIDSDFTFLNRRLAEHYGIDGVAGQEMRKVTLPKNSLRGGILTQASVLKLTANGTLTSPVKRGAYVLTNLLGTPPNPPPPGIAAVEPDTRGKTTVRELLQAHRNTATCASCHNTIDPPGFALESFDPIGGFRTRYRAIDPGAPQYTPYSQGPKVDASGTTAEGKAFSGIAEFKKHLLTQQERVAEHFIGRLVVYATGAELQFADRAQVATIAAKLRKEGYPVRSLLHEIVQSELFRNQ